MVCLNVLMMRTHNSTPPCRNAPAAIPLADRATKSATPFRIETRARTGVRYLNPEMVARANGEPADYIETIRARLNAEDRAARELNEQIADCAIAIGAFTMILGLIAAVVL